MKKRKSAILFISSFIILIALQAYYIYAAYRLEEKELKTQVNDIADILLKKMDSFENNTQESELVFNIKNLGKTQQSQEEKIEQIRRWNTSHKFYHQKVDSLLQIAVRGLNFNMAVKSEIYSIYDKNSNREILKENQPLVLFASKNPIKKGWIINEGIWNANQSKKDTELKLDNSYHYFIKSHTRVDLLNLNTLVLKNIALLILISLLISTLLAYLFWKSLKNLNFQQKKIEQLHTTIDSIAHELNTPITTIKFALQSMSPSASTSIIERQTKRIEKVVSSIHYPTQQNHLLLKTEVETYFNQIQKQYELIGFNLTIHFKKNIILNQNHFEDIMNNLIENSVKYKAQHIDILIHFDQEIKISIADDGIGVPQAEQKHIFEKYYRVSRAENLQVNGLGIGLYLVQEIVRNYKGKIAVKSNTKQGLTFTINIPNEN